MIGSFRNFAKTKLAGVFVFIIIIPFIFWGMGSMFSSGNTNTIVNINQSNVSTEEFIKLAFSVNFFGQRSNLSLACFSIFSEMSVPIYFEVTSCKSGIQRPVPTPISRTFIDLLY